MTPIVRNHWNPRLTIRGISISTRELLRRGVSRHPHQHRRVKWDEYGNGNNHDSSIQADEVPLVRDQISIPPLRQLDRPVDGPDIDHEEADENSREDHLEPGRDVLAQAKLPAADTADEVAHHQPEQRHGAELEGDAGHHDVRAQCLIRVRVRRRRHGPAGGLHHQGDDVARAKDDGVPLGREQGGRAAEADDEEAQEDIQCRAEEDGRDDEGDLLGEEGVAVVGALAGPRTGGPTYYFGCFGACAC